MSEVKVNKISPRSGTTVTLGDSGDTITLASGVSLTGVNATFSGDLTVDTDTLYVDSANNRVGIGTTSPSVTFDAEANGATVAHFNRTTDDGDILEFQKDGTTVGEIGTVSGTDCYIGSSSTADTGLRFQTDEIVPVGNAGGNRGDAIDLGKSNIRWKDFWLSGSIYIGGTTPANALDDYEKGTFTPTLEDSSSNAATGSFVGRYTKVGNRVTLDIRLVNINTTGLTAGSAVLIKGLPFAAQTSDAQVYSIGSVMSDSFTFSGYIVSELQGNSSNMELKDCSTGTGDAFIIVSDITSGTSDLLITHTYETD